MENNTNSKEKLIAYLSFIRDEETEKPSDEMDNDLIKDCVELLLELQNKEVTLSTEEIEDLVRKIPFADTDMIKSVNAKGKVRKFKKKKILLIAAVIAILIAILSIVSIAFEWNIFDALKDRFGSVANAPAGVEQHEDGISFERLGKDRLYENIEQISENEDLDILLPTNLPAGLSINKIKIYEIDGREEVLVSFNNDSSYIVTKNKTIPEEVLKNEKAIIGKTECYIENLEEVGLVQIHFVHKNNYYYFIHNDKQVLLDIIENLEEK